MSNNPLRTLHNLTPDDVARPSKEELARYVAHINFPFTTPPTRVPLPFPVSSAIAHYKKTVMVSVPTNGKYLVWAPSELQDNDIQNYLYSYDIDSEGRADTTTKVGILPTNDLKQYADSCRIVAAAIRVTYVGRLDETSGYIISLVSPGATKDLEYDQNSGSWKVTTLLQDDAAQISPVQDGLCAKWTPTDYDDLCFKTSKGTHDYEVAFAIQGTSTTASFLVETIQTVEYIPTHTVGYLIPGAKSKEHHDTSEILYHASKTKPLSTKKEDDSWWNTVKSAVSTATGIIEDVSDFVDKAAPIVELGASLL